MRSPTAILDVIINGMHFSPLASTWRELYHITYSEVNGKNELPIPVFRAMNSFFSINVRNQFGHQNWRGAAKLARGARLVEKRRREAQLMRRF